MSRSFRAKYAGNCSRCGRGIDVDVLIRSDGGGGYLHAFCPGTSRFLGPPAPPPEFRRQPKSSIHVAQAAGLCPVCQLPVHRGAQVIRFAEADVHVHCVLASP